MTATDRLRKAGIRGRRAVRPSGDDREAAILATSEALLAERAWAAVSVDDLARGAGISRPSFYFYFASKDAVLLTLLDRMVEEAHARRGDVLDRVAEDPRARWREAITAFHDTFRDHRAATVAAAAALPTSPEIRALWTAMMSRAVEDTSRVIKAERARGAAPDGVPASDLATALNSTSEAVLRATFAGQAPAISNARATPKRFRVAAKATPVIARAPKGTIFRFTLSAPSRVQIAITHKVKGLRKGSKCVKPTAKLRRAHARACERTVTAGRLTRTNENAGFDSVAFSGRIGSGALKPGGYRAVLSARNTGGSATPVALSFKVVR